MKKSRIQEMSLEVAVGAFMFTALLALGVFTIILSRQNLFQPVYRYEVFFPEVLSIREGDDVLLRGVPVGKIRRVSVLEREVRVELALDRELKLREDYRFEILPSSMLGGRHLYLHEGSLGRPPLEPGARLVGIQPSDLIDQATRTVQRIQKALEEGEILQNLEKTMANAREISDRISGGHGALGKLLTEEEVYDDFRQIVSNLREVSERLRADGSSLGRLLNDDGAVYADIAAITQNLKETTDRLNSGEGLIGRLLSSDDTLYEDLKRTADGLRAIVDTISAGEGTLGRLVRDESLFDDLKSLLGEVRATMDDFRETSPITTFTSILFGAF